MSEETEEPAPEPSRRPRRRTREKGRPVPAIVDVSPVTPFILGAAALAVSFVTIVITIALSHGREERRQERAVPSAAPSFIEIDLTTLPSTSSFPLEEAPPR